DSGVGGSAAGESRSRSCLLAFAVAVAFSFLWRKTGQVQQTLYERDGTRVPEHKLGYGHVLMSLARDRYTPPGLRHWAARKSCQGLATGALWRGRGRQS